MEKNFITAQEANEKTANCYSNMEDVCKGIQRAAERGQYKCRFYFISDIDIPKLMALGYTVTTNINEKFPYTVSWKFPKLKPELLEQLGDVFIKWADNYFAQEKSDEQLTDEDLYELFCKQHDPNREFQKMSIFKLRLQRYRDRKTKL